jgi:hypothetical protein
MNDHPKLDPWLRELLGRFPGWECWAGISGLLYARRRNTSPPVVLHAATADALAELIRLTDTYGDSWRFSYITPERIQPRTPGGGFIAKHRHRPGVEYFAPTADTLSKQITTLDSDT